MNTDKNLRLLQQTYQPHTGDVEPQSSPGEHLFVFIRVHLCFQILSFAPLSKTAANGDPAESQIRLFCGGFGKRVLKALGI
jgi:hypothetical protein